MRLPALWLAAAFAGGIIIGSRYGGVSPKHWLVGVLIGLALTVVLAWRMRLVLAWAMALVAWAALGGLACTLERVAVPANHVSGLIASGRIDLTQPLRWRGGSCERWLARKPLRRVST